MRAAQPLRCSGFLVAILKSSSTGPAGVSRPSARFPVESVNAESFTSGSSGELPNDAAIASRSARLRDLGTVFHTLGAGRFRVGSVATSSSSIKR
jgi:hypothetical protein